MIKKSVINNFICRKEEYMRAHLFQHVAFEGLGSIGLWLKAQDAVVTRTRFFENAELPGVDDVELLIIMGGPMSVNDETLYPWLVEEKRFIKEAIMRNKGVLGVCLGAQLIASSLGSRVFPNIEKEIGWFPIKSALSHEEKSRLFQFPNECLVFHWHGETFDLPPGATLLARSEVCDNQAFQMDRRVIGLQFHLETTPQTARDIVDNCHDELVPAKFVQSEETILSAPAERYEEINLLMQDVLSFIIQPGD
jgi:GMP synthase-like glutamine amidotransferase